MAALPRRFRLLITTASLTLVVGVCGAGEIRVACYSDGNECEVTQDLAKRWAIALPCWTI